MWLLAAGHPLFVELHGKCKRKSGALYRVRVYPEAKDGKLWFELPELKVDEDILVISAYLTALVKGVYEHVYAINLNVGQPPIVQAGHILKISPLSVTIT